MESGVNTSWLMLPIHSTMGKNMVHKMIPLKNGMVGFYTQGDGTMGEHKSFGERTGNRVPGDNFSLISYRIDFLFWASRQCSDRI